MFRTCVASLLFLAALTAGARNAAATQAADEGFEAIVKEMTQENQDLVAKYRAEKDPQEQAKIRAQILGIAPKYAKRFLDFARDNASDPNAATALGRVIASTRGGPQFEEALNLLVTNHIDSPEIATVSQALASSRDPKAEETLRVIAEKSKDRGAQGTALMALASRLGDSAGREGSAEKTQKAIAMLERVVKDYADVAGARGPLGDQAKADLSNLQKFGVGQVAPEIQAEDIDGVTFKLSDYRGKVVMLDFWGHW